GPCTSWARATLNVLLPTAEYATSVPIAAHRYATGQLLRLLFRFLSCLRGVLILILIQLLSPDKSSNGLEISITSRPNGYESWISHLRGGGILHSRSKHMLSRQPAFTDE